MRVATYTRISTDEANQPYSLEAQAQKLAAYVESQDGWTLVKPYTDRMSGAKLERPGLDDALEAARAGKFDLLLVYRVDRLARSVRGLAHILEELDAAGVAFRSATEPFDTSTAAGRMMVQMLGVFAEFERATIMDRVINGMERKAQRGGWCGGRRPFGYVHDKEHGVLVPKPDEAALVPAIFDHYLRKDMGSVAIAAWLNERGHRTKDGKPWSYTAVLTVLRNRVYVGEVTFRGITRTDAHEPLVDKATFEAAARLVGDRGARAPRANVKPKADYLLSGLLTCAKCGKHYVGAAGNGNRYRYRYYACWSRLRYGAKFCDAERLPADELDEAIVAALLALYGDHVVIERAVRRAAERLEKRGGKLAAEVAATDAKIANVERAIDKYLRAFEAGTMPDTLCGERLKELRDQGVLLRAHRDELAEALDAEQPTAPSSDQLAQLRDAAGKMLTGGSLPRRKALLARLVHGIAVEGRDRVLPVFRVPTTEATVELTKVRTDIGSVGATGFEPVTSAV